MVAILRLLPREAILEPGFWKTSPPVPIAVRPLRVVPATSATSEQHVASDCTWRLALAAIPNGEGDSASLGYDDWLRVVAAVHKETGGSSEGLDLARDWSMRSPKCDPDHLEYVWEHLDAERVDGAGAGTIVHMARELAGWVKPIEVGDSFGPVVVASKPPRPPETGDGAGGTSDGPGAALALNFPPVDEDPDFEREKSGVIKPTMGNTVAALRVPRMAGMRIAWDEFRAEMVVGPSEGDGLDGWRPMDDADMVRMRIRLETAGFKAAGKDQVRDAVVLVAAENRFDSAQVWLRGLMARWDGVRRVDGSMCTYFGCTDDKAGYARAVGRYVWTALAGRVLEPGCKADMAVIFAGEQGLRKTSAIEAIAPGPDVFVEVDLGEDEEKTVRKMRGALVAELAELSGLSTRALGDIKKYLSRRYEKWVPKYKEFPTQYPRRTVHFGTTNEVEVLADDTGERRWLPLEATRMDAEGIARDREQLWAEGALMFLGLLGDETGDGRKEAGGRGVAWQDAERLARTEGVHDAFTIADPWAERIADWLGAVDGLGAGAGPRSGSHFAMSDLLSGALGIATRDQSMAVQRRAGSVLKRIGYRSKATRIGAEIRKRWHAKA